MLTGLQVRTSRRVQRSWRGSYLQSVSTANLEIGWQIELTCSSDLDITSVDWYQGFNRIQRSYSSQSTLVRQSITTDDHGSVYRCFVRSPYAIQHKNIRLSVRGMFVNVEYGVFYSAESLEIILCHVNVGACISYDNDLFCCCCFFGGAHFLLGTMILFLLFYVCSCSSLQLGLN